MNIAYCTNVRLPSERAHGHQIAQVCDALVELGHTVDLYAPYRVNPIAKTFQEYYNASANVQLQYLGAYDFIRSPWTPGVLGLFAMNYRLRKHYHNSELHKYDCIYTRSEALLPALVTHGPPVILELHHIPKRNRKAFVRHCNQCAKVVCLTQSIKEALQSWGVEQGRLLVEGDAVDLKRFTNLPSQAEAKTHFGIQTDRPIVGYIGRLKTLGMDKGVSDLLKATKALQTDCPYFTVIVGGPDSDKREYEQQAKALGLTESDVLFTGSVPATEVPLALSACNVVAMPWPDKPHYRYNMSPLKMFEYMAAKKPILTSDLPTILEVLGEETAILCKPDDANSIAGQLTWIQRNPQDTQAKVEAATALLPHYSWSARMERVLNTLS